MPCHVLGAGYRYEPMKEQGSRILLDVGGLVEQERYLTLASTETNYRDSLTINV